MSYRVFIFACLTCAPQIVTAQTATSCVDQAWSAFRQEIESKENPLAETGDAYLAAYGWIRATETCLEATTYPAEKAQEAQDFRNAVGFTAEAVEQAVRTNTAPSIFALGQGADRTFYTYPEDAPTGGTGDQFTTTPGGNDEGTAGYRMLSMREWSRLQARLTRLGFDTDGADGIAGPHTFRAIARYQQSLGQRPTGLLTSRQIDRLLN